MWIYLSNVLNYQTRSFSVGTYTVGPKWTTTQKIPPNYLHSRLWTAKSMLWRGQNKALTFVTWKGCRQDNNKAADSVTAYSLLL